MDDQQKGVNGQNPATEKDVMKIRRECGPSAGKLQNREYEMMG
jgi:hypothetical protein